MVFSFRETVLGIEKPVVAGLAFFRPAMEPPRRSWPRDGRTAACPQLLSAPSDQDPTASKRRYPFGGLFNKESLEDFIFNPQSLGA